MKFGVDFGTTHTVVAWVDRGNYPVVSFEGGEVVPSLIAGRDDGSLVFGHAAAAVRRDPRWKVVRSIKRILAEAGPNAEIDVAGQRYRVEDLVTRFLLHVREELLTHSNVVPAGGDSPIEIAVSVPANSGSSQRFLTLDAFAQAGFHVTALLNEPSAAGFEYAHRYRSSITSRREYVAIYDLGGGTFDASLLKMTGRRSEVVSSEGVGRLGGDDFDAAIAALVLEKAGRPDLDSDKRDLLLEECARQKEAIRPNTRRVLFDLDFIEDAPLAVPVEEIFQACEGLVARSVDALELVLRDPFREGDRDEVLEAEIAGIYVVGGSGSFPLVPRYLRERFGERRVKRSPHPFAATAIGLAIFLDQEAGYSLADRLTRTFGVFREAEGGAGVVFDPIFGRDMTLPAPGEPPVEVVRRYQAAHNIGHYRFVECTRLKNGRPDGDVSSWAELLFPFARELRGQKELRGLPVLRLWDGPLVEERYSCSADGSVQVTLRDVIDGFSRSFVLGPEGAVPIGN
ncbi:MAG: Chaperone protein DnaK [Thermoanaerobaculia bacterium]|nr:Chaperone protein DnaK [Thermoanaerobaculia bacterium]